MKQLLVLALLAASPAPPQPAVYVAKADWAGLPALIHRGYDHLSASVMTKLWDIARTGKCRLPGQASGGRLDMSIPFAAQFDPQGRVLQLLLPPLNCPEAESWVGGTLLKSIQHGDFRPTGENPEGWYRGDLQFEYGG